MGIFGFCGIFGIFLGECAVSGVDFSPFAKAQNDKGFVIISFVGKFCKGKKAKFIALKCLAVSFSVRLHCKKCLNLA